MPEKLAFLALAGCVSLTQISIAASEILLAAASFGYLWLWKRHEAFPVWKLKIIPPLVAYMAWNVIAALASTNPMLGLTIAKKFFLFLLIVLVPALAHGKGRLIWIYKIIFAAAFLASLWGLLQYISDPDRDLLRRISGFMSQWMTYSGLLMMALVALFAYALCYGLKRHLWVVPMVICLALALIFAQTRSAWLGTLAGIALIILLRQPKATLGLVAVILAFYVFAPSIIKERLRSGFDPTDPNTRNRIELFQTAGRLICDHPWLGVGPKHAKYEALKYRGTDEFPDWMYQHMHNNILQVASETGITGLAIWLWFMIRFAWDASHLYHHAKRQPSSPTESNNHREALMVSLAALGVWIALMTAGLFEYNFGDSEVLMLFLFIVSAPYALADRRAHSIS